MSSQTNRKKNPSSARTTSVIESRNALKSEPKAPIE